MDMLIDFWKMIPTKTKIALIIGIIDAIIIASGLINIKKSPKKKVDFIKRAYEQSCFDVAKLSCLTLHGYKNPEYYLAEYAYTVNGLMYFVTYKITCPVADERKTKVDADMLLHDIKTAIIVFYEKNNPSNVIWKPEIFTSKKALKKVRTPKKNVWRNIHRQWTAPIDLIQH